MSSINQKEYLKKYLSGEKSSKKKKLKKSKPSKSGLVILDNDFGDLRNLKQGDADDDDAPTVAEVTYDCNETRIRDLQNSDPTKWKQSLSESNHHKTGSLKSIGINNKLSNHEKNVTSAINKNSSKFESSTHTQHSKRPDLPNHRHDSDSSPARRHDSPFRKHNSNASPPRRYDSDASPPRKNNSLSKRKCKTINLSSKQHNSSESPSRKRYDSDESPPRERCDSDESPPRKRYDSDESPPRKRYDSDESPPRKRCDSDESPPRKRCDSDESPPRKRNDSDESPPRKRDNNASHIQESATSSSKREFGNMTTREYLAARKANKLKKKTEEEIAKAEREAKLQEYAEQAHKLWNKGIAQAEQQKKRTTEILHEMNKEFARSAQDKDYNEHLKNKVLAEDPMLEYIAKKKEKESNQPRYPVYQGPFPHNRFNIRPGYRWDGVDRSNGFEEKYMAKISSDIALQEEAYKYSAEDL